MKKRVTFDTLDVNAPIFSDEPDAKNNVTWQQLKFYLQNDPHLYWEIRKDNQVNVYYEGGSLIRLHYCSKHKRFQAFIHEKYLGNKGSKYVDLLNLIEENNWPIVETINSIKQRIRAIYSARNGVENEEKWSEKYLQGGMLTGTYCYGPTKWIDSEFAYKDNEFDIRIDLISLEDGELRFWELKRLDDPRMLKSTEDAPEVVRQMRDYKRFAQTYEKELIAYFEKVKMIKQKLGVWVPAGKIQRLNTEPLLIIYNRWTKPTAGRLKHMERMENILKREHIDYRILKKDRLLQQNNSENL